MNKLFIVMCMPIPWEDVSLNFVLSFFRIPYLNSIKASFNCPILGLHNSKYIDIISLSLQILSDIPFSEKWQRCPSSLDRLVWLTQKRNHVRIFPIFSFKAPFSCSFEADFKL